MSASNLPPPASNEKKPLASISLDLDNQWSYMKTHGDLGWKNFPSYLDIFIPRVLNLLDRLNLKITFFIVGQDAALDKNKDVLKLLADRGHEISNHSFHHEPWLHFYGNSKIEKEILTTEEQIIRATGKKPVGFRGPGYSWNSELLKILADNDYLYDTSTFPTYLGPVARFYYFWISEFTKDEKKQRNGLFGGFRDGLRPVKPYRWQLVSGKKLIEIPVTTIPIIKTPFHLSYLLYLSRISTNLMLFYLTTALRCCLLTKTEPTFLLHPLDLISGDQVPELAFFPGMDLSSQKKIEIFKKVFQKLSKHFNPVCMSTHAKSLLERNDLKVISLPKNS
jgi:hypothetical protein